MKKISSISFLVFIHVGMLKVESYVCETQPWFGGNEDGQMAGVLVPCSDHMISSRHVSRPRLSSALLLPTPLPPPAFVQSESRFLTLSI